MKVKQNISSLLIKLSLGLLNLVGLRSTRFLARSIGSFFYYIIPLRKRVVIQNLKVAFPDQSIKTLNSWAHQTYQSVCTTFLELMLFPKTNANVMKSQIIIEQPREINSIIEEGKGVIFWTGHLGSWEVGGISFPLHFDKVMYCLAKKQTNSTLNELIKNARESYGNKMIWLGASVRHIIEVLKRGGIVGIVGDQRGPVDSPRVMFFGKPTAFYSGTATIIAKTKCNVILSCAVRRDDGKYQVIYEKMNLESLPENFEEKVKEINQRYAAFLEKIIKLYPSQYFWMHKLWKY